MNKKLFELFLERCIRIEAVQRERAAAVEDVRCKRMEVTEEDMELFFDFGIKPISHSSLWPIKTWTIERNEIDRELAFYRAYDAAVGGWHPLVRDLRGGKMIATRRSRAASLARSLTGNPDRREIERGTWLREGLLFDVRDNAICEKRQRVGSFGYGRVTEVHKLWDGITVSVAGGESATETDQPTQTKPAEAGSEPVTESGQSNQAEPVATTADTNGPTTPQEPQAMRSYEDLPELWQILIAIMRRVFPDAHTPEDILKSAGSIRHLRGLLSPHWQKERDRWNVAHPAKKVMRPMPKWDVVKSALKNFSR